MRDSFWPASFNFCEASLADTREPMRKWIALGTLLALAACQQTLTPDARQYIEQQAVAYVGGMSDNAVSDSFVVGDPTITDIGPRGACGLVATSRGPVLFVATSKDVGGGMIVGPGPNVSTGYFQATIERVRAQHLEIVVEAAGDAGCELPEAGQ